MTRAYVTATVVLVITVLGVRPVAQGSGSWLSAAKGRPIEFAMSLITASIPVGLETPVSDRQPLEQPDMNLRREAALTIDALANAFNASHTNYRAAVMNGVLVLRPAARRARYLDQSLDGDELVVTGAMVTLRRIFAGLDPRLHSGGIAGSRFVDANEAGDHVTVTLTAGGTVLRALNEMASQTRQGWIVVTATSTQSEVADIVEVGLLHRGGSTSNFSLVSRP